MNSLSSIEILPILDLVSPATSLSSLPLASLTPTPFSGHNLDIPSKVFLTATPLLAS